MSDRTTISVSKELVDALYERKDREETYEELLWELLEQAED